MPSLSRTIEQRVGVQVEQFDPFRNVQIDPKLFNLEYINEIRPLAAVAVGLGLRRRGDKGR